MLLSKTSVRRVFYKFDCSYRMKSLADSDSYSINGKDVSDYFEHKGNADPIKTGEALTEAFGRLDGVDDPYKKIDEIDKVLNVE